MKKFLLSLAALMMVCFSVSAKTKNAVFETPADQGKWDTENKVYSWTAGYSNLVTIFDCNVDKLSNYTSLHLKTSDLVDGPYRVCFMNGGTAVATITFYSAGQKDLVLSEREETKNLDLKSITHIAFGGASGAGSVKVENVYLEGLDIPAEATLTPTVGADIKTLTGTNTNWDKTVTYPMAFQSQSASWGDGNGDKESSHVNIDGYKKLSFIVSQGSDKGLGLRVWIWDDVNNKVVTLFAHPETDYATANFAQSYEIKDAGVYSVNIEGYKYLKGVKAANKWEGQTPVIVESAIIGNGDYNLVAVDEARTFSFGYPLDFSSVTDVDAYIATSVADGKVAMKKVAGAVPANTGLILIDKTGKSVVSIPTCETATEDVTGNLLVATTVETTVTSGYVLAGTDADLGWYSIGSVQPKLAAGKAYLGTTNSAKTLQLSFDEDATAITTAKTVKADGAIYTIQGIKVAAPKKGNMYIQNGKKFIF